MALFYEVEASLDYQATYTLFEHNRAQGLDIDPSTSLSPHQNQPQINLEFLNIRHENNIEFDESCELREVESESEVLSTLMQTVETNFDYKTKLMQMQEKLTQHEKCSALGRHGNATHDIFIALFLQYPSIRRTIYNAIKVSYRSQNRKKPNFNKANNELFVYALKELFSRKYCAVRMLIQCQTRLFSESRISKWHVNKLNYYKRMLWTKIQLADEIRRGCDIPDLKSRGLLRINKSKKCLSNYHSLSP